MRAALTLHPDSVCEAVIRIGVDVVRGGAGVLGLRYLVEGRIADLAFAPPGPPMRADELWRHSCFEAFLADEAGKGYTELNVAPSRQWAGYRFSGYRSERKDAAVPAPRIEVEASAERFDLRVALWLRAGGNRRVGMSAVIEETNGRLSYWALAHPPGAPDFHHPDCFALQVPPRSAP